MDSAATDNQEYKKISETLANTLAVLVSQFPVNSSVPITKVFNLCCYC